MNLSVKIISAITTSLILLSLIIIFPGNSRAGRPEWSEIEVKSEITGITIFRQNQVTVSRSGSVKVEPGLYRFIFAGLPERMDRSSVQVEGSGTAEAEINSIEPQYVKIDTGKPQLYDELSRQLEVLQSRKDSLEIIKSSLRKRLEMVSSFSDLSAEKAKEKLVKESLEVADWVDILDFVQNENTNIKRELSLTNKEMDKLTEQIVDIRGRIDKLSVTEGGYEVRIECEVHSGGELNFNLSYLLNRGAHWNPQYRVLYIDSKEVVQLDYKAYILQQSGEDWENVNLVLSTAQPSQGSSAPTVEPSYLKKLKMPKRIKSSDISYSVSSDELETMNVDPLSTSVVTGDELSVRGGREASRSVGFALAGFTKSSFSANFNIQSPVSLSSGSTRTFLIKRVEFPVELSLFAAPRLSENVYTTGKLINRMDFPILQGNAGVYVETEKGGGSSIFVGEGDLHTVPPGSKFVIHLGIDQDIKVEHDLKKKEYLSREDDRRKEIRYHYLITAENFKKRAVELILRDRIPVSTVDDIEVEDVDIEPDPAAKNKEGIVAWNIPLEAGEKYEIQMQYTVSFPADWPEYSIINLE